MKKRIPVGIVSLAAFILMIGVATPLSADTASEIAELRAELEKQRADLRVKEEALLAQRKSLDESMRKLEILAQKNGMDFEPVKVESSSAESSLTEIDSENVRAQMQQPVTDPDEQTKLEVYGFAQLDTIYDFDRVDPDWKSTLRPSRIPVNCPGDPGCGKDGETIASVRQSRLGFKGQTPSQYGPAKAHIEFDLFATGDKAGDTDFRLRHAYGEVGQVLAGQTWSLFMDPDVFPNTVDYWGPAGMIFLRNPQLRWTPYREDGTSFAVAIEAPNSAVDPGNEAEADPTLNVVGRTELPDLTLQARHSDDFGWVQLAALFREVAFESPDNPPTFAPEGEEFGYGVNLTAGINVFERDRILAQFVYGEGIASYFNDGGVDLAPDSSSQAEAVPSYGWLAYYNRQWDDEWTSSFGFSEHRQDNSSGQTGDALESGQYLNVNLLYHPSENLLFGPEFLWGRRKNNDGADGEDSRIQFSAKYSFGGTVYGPDAN